MERFGNPGEVLVALEPKLEYARCTFLESFRRRGLVPRDLRTLSVDTLRWNGAEIPPRLARRLSKIALWLPELAAELDYVRDRRRLFYARARRARGCTGC